MIIGNILDFDLYTIDELWKHRFSKLLAIKEFLHYIDIGKRRYFYYKGYYLCKFDIGMRIDRDYIGILYNSIKSIISVDNIILPLSLSGISDLGRFENCRISFFRERNGENIFFLVKSTIFYTCCYSKLEESKDILFAKYQECKNSLKPILYLSDKKSVLDIVSLEREFYSVNYWVDIITDLDSDQLNSYDTILINNNDIRLFKYLVDHKISVKKIIMLQSIFADDYGPKKSIMRNVPNDIYDKIHCCCSESFFSKTENYERIRRYFTHIYKSPVTKIDLNSDKIMNKSDFFRVNSFDLNKGLIVIFLGKINYIWAWKQQTLERNILCDNFLENLVTLLEQKGYNVIFKIHPSRNTIIGRKIKINNKDLRYTKNNTKLEIEYIENIYNKFNFIDNCFYNEIYKYTDFAIVFSLTTTRDHLYIYNIPCLAIDSKNDFFSWARKLKEMGSYPDKYGLSVEDYIKKYHYGMYVFYEDWTGDSSDMRLREMVNSFLNTDYESVGNHPYYGNTYDTNYSDIVKIVKDIVE